MDEFMSEKEQVEALREWWRENAVYIIAGLIIGVGGLGAWRAWQDFKIERATRASDSYEALSDAVDASDVDAATTLVGSLRDDYSATPYATLGSLMLARLYVQDGELALAADALTWVMDHASDPEMILVARLRLARIRVSMGDPTAALAVTAEVTEPGAFEPLLAEVEGDAHAALGDLNAARASYQRALDTIDDGVGDPQLIEMKLNDTLTVTPVQEVDDEAEDEAEDGQ